MFLTTGDHAQGRLWARFFEGQSRSEYGIYSHPKDASALRHPFLRENVIPERVPTMHGHVSLVRATLLLLKQAHADPLTETFALLSDSCIPLHSFARTRELIDCGKSIIAYETAVAPEKRERWKTLSDPSFVAQDRFTSQSQWMVLRRDAVEVVLKEDFTHVFERTYAADEHYFVNVLLRAGFSLNDNVVNRRVTFANWAEREVEQVAVHVLGQGVQFFRKARPKTYRELSARDVAAARAAGCLFFRKVSPTCDCRAVEPLIFSE